MSLPRLVTACLCSWGLHSGYIQLSIRDVVSGGFDIITVEHYFGNCADISEHTVYVSTNDTPTDQVELMVFFDRNLHQNGTQRCSYLVVKKTAGSQAVDLMQSDYVAVVIAIDECVHFFVLFSYLTIRFSGFCKLSLPVRQLKPLQNTKPPTTSKFLLSLSSTVLSTRFIIFFYWTVVRNIASAY
jgi:hypothetical protein